jgi:predicted metal-dependent hydrolase
MPINPLRSRRSSRDPASMTRRRAAALETPQLPLFADAPGDAPVPAYGAAGPEGSAPPVPGRPVGPEGSGTALQVLRHPQATREIRLDQHLVGYALKRARRRSIGFVVGTEGLSVAAPRWVGHADIDAALREKSSWILRKLAEQQERAQRLLDAKVDWCDGTTLPFLGEPVTIVLDPRVAGAVLDARGVASPDLLRLHVGLPDAATAPQIRAVVQGWLQRQARRVFEERCAHYAPRLGVRVRRLALSSAQTRWGSANVDGTIRLNWRLIHFALPSIDYVVVHELAHLREMNHSPRFWAVVRSVLPDYAQARGTLKDGLLPLLD